MGAKEGSRLLDRLAIGHPDKDGTEMERLKKILTWFRNEARESKTPIAWLLKEERRRRAGKTKSGA